MSYLTYPNWLARLLQRWHLGRSRMGRLLRRRAIDVSAYLHAFPIVEIETQLARCYSCPCKGLCDRALQARGSGRSRYSFCPNTPFIQQFAS
jgi:hypothetical protein